MGLALFPSDSFDAGNAPEDEELIQPNGTGFITFQDCLMIFNDVFSAPAKKKSKGKLNLVDRHIKKDESGKGYMPETLGEKVYGMLVVIDFRDVGGFHLLKIGLWTIIFLDTYTRFLFFRVRFNSQRPLQEPDLRRRDVWTYR